MTDGEWRRKQSEVQICSGQLTETRISSTRKFELVEGSYVIKNSEYYDSNSEKYDESVWADDSPGWKRSGGPLKAIEEAVIQPGQRAVFSLPGRMVESAVVQKYHPPPEA